MWRECGEGGEHGESVVRVEGLCGECGECGGSVVRVEGLCGEDGECGEEDMLSCVITLRMHVGRLTSILLGFIRLLHEAKVSCAGVHHSRVTVGSGMEVLEGDCIIHLLPKAVVPSPIVATAHPNLKWN